MARRIRRRLIRIVLTASVLAVAGGFVELAIHHKGAPDTGCTATADGQSWTLDLNQSANAATIAAVARSMNLPDHAVTVALATALQESGLYNLDYGDKDSLGLFQQRPSQGWGTPTELLSPVYAAGAFYQRLSRVPDWQQLPVTVAAQDVQHSADPSGYADWADEARTLAVALTGESPAAFTCTVVVHGSLAEAQLAAQARTDFGSAVLSGHPSSTRAGWAVASWVLAHASGDSVREVGYDGWRWTAAGGVWKPDPAAGGSVTVS